MKRLLLLTIVALGLVVPSSAPSFQKGTCIELEGQTLEGTQYEPKTDDQWTIVEFWATWCTPCVGSIDELRRLTSRFADVQLVGINSERDLARVRAFADRRKWDFTTLVDPDQELLARANPRALPLTVLLDPNGCVVWRGVGGDERTLESLAKTLSKRERSNR